METMQSPITNTDHTYRRVNGIDFDVLVEFNFSRGYWMLGCEVGVQFDSLCSSFPHGFKRNEKSN